MNSYISDADSLMNTIICMYTDEDQHEEHEETTVKVKGENKIK